MDVQQARWEFVRDYADPAVAAAAGGQASGIDLVPPEYVLHDVLGAVKNKRKHSSEDLTVYIPETSASGLSPAGILRAYFQVAPREGLLFRWPAHPGAADWGPPTDSNRLENRDFNAELRRAIRATRPAWADDYVAKFSSHSFRGGAATNMGAAGVPVAVVSQTLGHTSASAVQSYLHMSSDVRRRALYHAVQ